jgi:hypothetical protein
METTTRHIGTCGACGRSIKVRNGTLVHHGYERPGYGYIEGDCFGVHYEPHEVSPKCAQDFLTVLSRNCESTKYSIDNLPNRTQMMVNRGTARNPQFETYHKDSTNTLEVHRFEKALEALKRELEVRLRQIQLEIKRVEDTLVGWAPKDLVTVEEEKAAKKLAKADADAARQAKREAKVEALVAKTKQRILSAQKRRTASVFLQVFDTTPGKIQEFMNYEVSRQVAYEKLGLNGFWKVLGLLTDDGGIVHETQQGRYKSYSIPWDVKDAVEKVIQSGALDSIKF